MQVDQVCFPHGWMLAEVKALELRTEPSIRDRGSVRGDKQFTKGAGTIISAFRRQTHLLQISGTITSI